MNVGIIGAGFAGLAAAYDLTRQGHQVAIFEAGAEPGGLASGFKADGWDWRLERFYHHLFTSDYDIINLAKEIGIGDKVIFKRPITALWFKDRPYPFDSFLAQFRFPHLSLYDKVRAAPAVALLKFTRWWRPLEQYTAHEWLPKWMGRHTYELIWEPLLIGKFGEHYRDVPMSWIWARVYKRSTKLGYFVGGFQVMANALAQRVEAQRANIVYRCAVQQIAPVDGKIGIRLPDGQERLFDRAIFTGSPKLLTRLTPALPESYLASLQNLKGLGAVVMILALDRKITENFYWISLMKEQFPFLAYVEHTNFMDPAHYGGDHLVYLGDYLPPSHRYFQMSQQEMLDLFLPSLKKFNPAFDPSWVRQSWLFREPYAQPVIPLNYSKMIPPFQTPIPGLYFASMAQVYPWDRGTNYAVEMGRKVAKMIDEPPTK